MKTYARQSRITRRKAITALSSESYRRNAGRLVNAGSPGPSGEISLDVLAHARGSGRGDDRQAPLRHLCRFLILGLYIGSRPGAILNATWDRGPGRSHVDIEYGVFHRQAEGKAETNKRQPSVKLSPRLKARKYATACASLVMSPASTARPFKASSYCVVTG
ncbi:hypothetical protein [Methylosinus sporium]|uniref:hypothetical protein n=1 Tax=Methylosinus sporium TaxID=428 RepID=UPI00383A52D6